MILNTFVLYPKDNKKFFRQLALNYLIRRPVDEVKDI